MATVLIVGVRIPFVRGGQDVLVSSLQRELAARGHLVDCIELPLTVSPKDRLLKEAAIWRSINLDEFAGKKVDVVIATKFPSYYVKHPRKSVWLVHQHRQMYDLYGSRFTDFSDDLRDEELRKMLMQGDTKVLGEAAYLSGISRNVVDRLHTYNGLKAETLYPPLPLSGKYRNTSQQPYILSVGRLCAIKRTDLAIVSMLFAEGGVKLKVVGSPETPGIMRSYEEQIDYHGLGNRIEFLGRVGDEELLDLYANSLGVMYVPLDEDYGYVTLEAMASGKPVITAEDSGGVLEFVRHEENGLICPSQPQALGAAVNRLYRDLKFAEQLGRTGQQLVVDAGVSDSGWEHVINRLLSPIGV